MGFPVLTKFKSSNAKSKLTFYKQTVQILINGNLHCLPMSDNMNARLIWVNLFLYDVYFHVRNFTVIVGRLPGLYEDKVSCSSITQPLEILVSTGHSTKRATQLSNIFSFSFYELQELRSLTRTFAARKHKYMYLKQITPTPLDRELFLHLFDGGCSHSCI